MKINFNEVSRQKGFRFGARKYGTIESETAKGTFYQWSKVRERDGKTYSYHCTCGDFMFRGNKRCKHIRSVQEKEAELRSK